MPKNTIIICNTPIYFKNTKYLDKMGPGPVRIQNISRYLYVEYSKFRGFVLNLIPIKQFGLHNHRLTKFGSKDGKSAKFSSS